MAVGRTDPWVMRAGKLALPLNSCSIVELVLVERAKVSQPSEGENKVVWVQR